MPDPSELVDIANLFPKQRWESEDDLVEDVSMDGPMETEPKLPCVRRDLKCGDCGSRMHLVRTHTGHVFYGCTRFPECRSTHGAHPDGRPMGVPGDKKTRQARIQVHKLLDHVWTSKHLTRPQTYAWMRKKLKLSEDDAHIAKLTYEQCMILIGYIRKSFPFVRTAWDRLRENPFIDPRTVKRV